MDNSEVIKKKFENKLEIIKKKIDGGEPILPEDKIQVAVLADSPNVVTGFGNVCREILTHLYNTGIYEFEIVGINYDGSPHNLPFRIHPAMNALIPDPAYREPYGRQKFLDIIGEGRFDIVWVLQDTFILCEELSQRIQETNDALPVGDQFAFVMYFPIDATPKKRWIDLSALVADIPVVYTKYGRDEVFKLYDVDENSKLEEKDKEKNLKDGEEIKRKLMVVYHGVNTENFYPLESERITELRAQLWGEHKDKFVFSNINRNQPRKDLFRTLQAFKILLDRRRAKGKDDVYLYLHCNIFDNGMNIIDMGKQLNIVEGNEYGYPDPKRFGPSQGYPINIVNDIYNASDAIVTTTLGEGWGLSITEAMATKRPIIAPDHTSITEMLGKTAGGTAERGILVQTKGDFVQQSDNARVRPITDPVDMADKMEFVLENREVLQPMVETAYNWIKELEWNGEKIGGTWESIFTAAYAVGLQKRSIQLDKQLAEELKKQNIGRNDICPICKDTKFKHCRHGKGLE